MAKIAIILATLATSFATTGSVVVAEPVMVPRFVPPQADAGAGLKPPSIRFITSDDFPPMNFIDGSGRLTGYNVELARLICSRLGIPCTIQVRPFPLLVQTLKDNKADAVVAGIAETPALGALMDYGVPYLRLPARFVVRRGTVGPIVPETLGEGTVAVPAGSRYADFLADFFPRARRMETADFAAALAALRDGTVDAAFGGALPAAFWLSGPEAADCCAFGSGPFTEPAYFGRGLSIAVREGDDALMSALDGALAALEADGSLADLYLRFFPVSLY